MELGGLSSGAYDKTTTMVAWSSVLDGFGIIRGMRGQKVCRAVATCGGGLEALKPRNGASRKANSKI